MPLPQTRYNASRSWSTANIPTSTTGTAFTPLAQQPCDEVSLYIPSGSSIDLKQSGADDGAYVTLAGPPGTLHRIVVGGDASEISVRRTDVSNTPLIVRYIWLKTTR